MTKKDMNTIVISTIDNINTVEEQFKRDDEALAEKALSDTKETKLVDISIEFDKITEEKERNAQNK